MTKKGLLREDSPPEVWRITEAGREHLRDNRGESI